MLRRTNLLILGIAALAACSDDSTPTAVSPSPTVEMDAAGALSRYVAIGTSISMGTQSDGTVGASQKQSWVAQLSNRAESRMSLPLISGTGCRAPFKLPLITFQRTSGEPVSTPTANLICAPLQEGVRLPARNVAIAGASTADAMKTTPETQPDPFYRKLYALVLPPQTTQLGAMSQLAPRFVSVELGANEILPAVSGVAIVGVTITPYATWAPTYRAVVDSVGRVVKKAILVGLIHDVTTFPGMRHGNEIWQDRASLLAAFNVAVDSDCNGSANLVFVPARIPAAVAAGLTNRSKGLPPFPFTCADSGLTKIDYVLTPQEAGIVNTALAQYNSEIASVASQHGFAWFELEAVYGRPDIKEPFRAVDVMYSANPYGRFTSADGIHPSSLGSSVLTDAAVKALNATYRLGLPSAAVIAAR